MFLRIQFSALPTSRYLFITNLCCKITGLHFMQWIQHFCHCWEHCWYRFFGCRSQWLCWISETFSKWCSFILGNITKSQGAKSEEYRGWETTVMLLAAKDCCYFCSSVSNQGTNSMDIFHILKSSLRMNGMLHTGCAHNMHNCWLAEKQHRK